MDRQQVQSVFETAFERLRVDDQQLLKERVSERCLCGRLAIYLEDLARQRGWHGYFADVEYNRKQDGGFKTYYDGTTKGRRITTDLVLHNRRRALPEAPNNLLALEMKKWINTAKDAERRENDRFRLAALTRDEFATIYPTRGRVSPQHVFGYVLGVFVVWYKTEFSLEYWVDGESEREFRLACGPDGPG